MIPRFFKPPHSSFFLFGPRGTGKTTWINACFPDAEWINLLKTDQVRQYSAKPEYLKEKAGLLSKSKIIVIDEIQKVPELLSIVHLLIEEDKTIQFVLTGSSARKLKRTGVDLLAGRAVLKALHPFIAAEIGDSFNLSTALHEGMLPIVFSAKNRTEVLKTYIDLYLREEVQMEGLVRNVGNFSRFLEAISFSHGSVINYSEIARECEVERKVVQNYVQILEDLLLAFRIPVFTKRAKRKTIVSEKLYLFDAGVYRSLRPAGPLDRPEEIEGIALEGLIIQHLKAWNAYRGDKNSLYYWRTYHHQEVDFIVYGDDGFWAIEVKNTARVRPADLRSLKSFQQDYPECQAILLYRGKEKFLRDNIACLPCEDFLKNLTPDKTISL
ncbi:MAG: AAA family ATPase [bacterium]